MKNFIFLCCCCFGVCLFICFVCVFNPSDILNPGGPLYLSNDWTFSLRRKKATKQIRKFYWSSTHFPFFIPSLDCSPMEKGQVSLVKSGDWNKQFKTANQVSSPQLLPLEGEEYNPAVGFLVFRERGMERDARICLKNNHGNIEFKGNKCLF